MKLKFTDEVQAIVNTIAQLPDTGTELEDLTKAWTPIGAFDKELIKLKGTMPTKQWVKQRRQLSFLFEVVLASITAGNKVGHPDSREHKQEKYRILVQSFKGMVSGEALKDIGLVRIAMNYGVLRLSDHEIAHLIEYNKI